MLLDSMKQSIKKGEFFMAELTKVLVLNNQIEADLMGEILKEHNIPHFIQSYHDTAYDGIFQFQKGWGHIEAAPEHHDEILTIYKNLTDAEMEF